MATTKKIQIIGGFPQSDYAQTDENAIDYIKNKPASLPADGGDADTVNGHTVDSDVPADAKFTDTVYTHPNSGVTAGTYKSVTVDEEGHITDGTNPTTLAGYGITDAATSAQGKKADTAYQKPTTGVPKTDLTTGVQASLNKADNAMPKTGGDFTGVVTVLTPTTDMNPATKKYVDTEVANIINSAPEALDTLQELSKALGDDPNFATTVSTEIGKKANKATTLAGYGITDAYTKQEVEDKIADKDMTNYYTKQEIDSGVVAKIANVNKGGTLSFATFSSENEETPSEEGVIYFDEDDTLYDDIIQGLEDIENLKKGGNGVINTVTGEQLGFGTVSDEYLENNPKPSENNVIYFYEDDTMYDDVNDLLNGKIPRIQNANTGQLIGIGTVSDEYLANNPKPCESDVIYFNEDDTMYNDVVQVLDDVKNLKDNTYTKQEVDDKIGDGDMTNYYTKQEIDNKIGNIDMSDYYTKVEIDGKVMPKTGGVFTGSVTVLTPTANMHPATKQYVDEKVAGVVNSAPETLDTLQELSKALGDDPNFATTVSTEIGKKHNKTDGDLLTKTAQSITGLKTFENGATFQGTALDAGLKTRGICGVKNDGITKEHLYLNYDGNDNYSRKVYLGGTSESAIAVRKDMLDGAVGEKADKSTTLAGYGITDAYTKTEVDGKIYPFTEEEINKLKILLASISLDSTDSTIVFNKTVYATDFDTKVV